MSQQVTNIKKRISSITGAYKITSAMKLVSSVKLKKWRKSMLANKEYSIEIEELTAEVFRINGFDDFPKDEVFGRLVNPELLYWQD